MSSPPRGLTAYAAASHGCSEMPELNCLQAAAVREPQSYSHCTLQTHTLRVLIMPDPSPTGRFLPGGMEQVEICHASVTFRVLLRLHKPAMRKIAAMCECCAAIHCYSRLGCSLFSHRWLKSLVHVLEEAAECIIIYAAWVVCCMLPECELPEATADLVATLANLHGDQLTWHLPLSAAVPVGCIAVAVGASGRVHQAGIGSIIKLLLHCCCCTAAGMKAQSHSWIQERQNL